MSDCRKCAEFDWCVENEDCGLFKLKPMTNADRIRSMTDEELAEFIEKPNGKPWYRCDECKWESCKECLLEWLKQESEGD